MKARYILMAGLVLAAACTKDPSAGSDREMRFAPSFGADTKATASAFETGDVIGVYVTAYADGKAPLLELGGNHANNAALTFNGTAWTADPKIYWEDGTFDVYAYYPRMNVTSVDEQPFSVALDQSTARTGTTPGGYEASDLLFAKKAGVTRAGGTVPLAFSHKLSRVDVKILKGEDYTGEISEDIVVKILSTVTEATVDLSSGTVTKNPYASAETITAKKNALGSYSAIVVPQRLDNRLPLVEILVSGVSYLVESRFVFKAGTCHTVNITLNNDPEKVKIDIGGQIENW